MSEEQLKEKMNLQMLVSSQREIAEKVEAETAVKVEAMLARHAQGRVRTQDGGAKRSRECRA